MTYVNIPPCTADRPLVKDFQSKIQPSLFPGGTDYTFCSSTKKEPLKYKLCTFV